MAENLELSDFKKFIIMDHWDRKLTETIDEQLISKKKKLYLRKICKWERGSYCGPGEMLSPGEDSGERE